MKDLILQTAKILLLFLLAALLAGILRGSRKQVDFSILEGAVQGQRNGGLHYEQVSSYCFR